MNKMTLSQALAQITSAQTIPELKTLAEIARKTARSKTSKKKVARAIFDATERIIAT